MTTFHWSVASALYQVRNGEPGTDRTLSAGGFLADLTDDPVLAAKIALDLLAHVMETRQATSGWKRG